MRRNAKVDKNQAALVAQIRQLGGHVLHVYQLKNAFDLLIGYRGKLYIIEIKADSKGKLTKGEQQCKDGFNSVGVDYHIIWSIEQFIEITKK